MNKQKWTAVLCAAILGCTFTLGAAATDTLSVGPRPVNFGSRSGGLMQEAESMMEDVMPGGEPGSGTVGSDTAADSSGTLGDTSDGTSGDGAVEGTADGFLGDESEMMDESSSGAGDTETETAATSSGEQSRGIGIMGVVLILIIIAAVAALLFALMPKRRNG